MASASGQFLLGLIVGVCALFLLDPEAELDGPGLMLTGAAAPAVLALIARAMRWTNSIILDAAGASLGYSLVVASVAAASGAFDSSPVSIFVLVFPLILATGVLSAVVVDGGVTAWTMLFRRQQGEDDETDGA